MENVLSRNISYSPAEHCRCRAWYSAAGEDHANRQNKQACDRSHTCIPSRIWSSCVDPWLTHFARCGKSRLTCNEMAQRWRWYVEGTLSRCAVQVGPVVDTLKEEGRPSRDRHKHTDAIPDVPSRIPAWNIATGGCVAAAIMRRSSPFDPSEPPVAIGLAPCRCGECTLPSSKAAFSLPTVRHGFVRHDVGALLAVSRLRPSI